MHRDAYCKIDANGGKGSFIFIANVSFDNCVKKRDRDNLLDLCDRLLDVNPDMRPTTQQILLHPFFKDMLPTSQLVKINGLKKCEQPLLNMVIRNME